ncbi:MAG: tRNA 2-thiocytidine biosynthesis protein TtcA [Clostridiales bacterium]|nr:tRNA 2-thiocytidine biosynthesis protein TtcA [Clostridiales bacterium]
MKELEFYRQVERSIVKKFRKGIFSPFLNALKRYDMIQAGDKIAVCISGGKDSVLLAKCMQILKVFSSVPFELEFLAMDPGYAPANRKKIEENCELLNIPVTFFNTDIFEVSETLAKSPCYLCARMRRGNLYATAREMGCNKIALGHHFNDVIETTMLGLLYAGQIQAMLPKLRSKNFEGMELIRPLYTVHEDDIIAWKKYNNLEFINCACSFTARRDAHEDGIGDSKRQEIKETFKAWKKLNPDVEKSVFKAIHSVSLDTMPGYKYKGKYYDFLDDY